MEKCQSFLPFSETNQGLKVSSTLSLSLTTTQHHSHYSPILKISTVRVGNKRQTSGKLRIRRLHGFPSRMLSTGTRIQKAPGLGLMFSAAILKFLIILEHGAPYFHFALGSAYYIGGPIFPQYQVIFLNLNSSDPFMLSNNYLWKQLCVRLSVGHEYHIEFMNYVLFPFILAFFCTLPLPAALFSFLSFPLLTHSQSLHSNIISSRKLSLIPFTIWIGCPLFVLPEGFHMSEHLGHCLSIGSLYVCFPISS